MSSEQLQLKELLTAKPTERFPSLKEILQTYNSFKQFQHQIVTKIDDSKSSKVTFEEQGKELREKFKLAFEALDQQIEHKIKNISLKIDNNARERQKSSHQKQETEVQLQKDKRSQMQAKSCQKNITKRPQDKELTTKKQFKHASQDSTVQTDQANPPTHQKHSDALIFKNVTLISKNKKTPIEIYTCFICIRNGVHKSMWEKQQPYLTHMAQSHNLDLKLENLVEGEPELLQCSHAFVRGNLVYLLRNIENTWLRHETYLLTMQRYDELYFCGCNTMSPRSCILSTEQQFFQHIRSHQTRQMFTRYLSEKDLQSGSHIVHIKDKIATVVPNKKFDNKAQLRYKGGVQMLKDKYFRQVKRYTFNRMLAVDKMNYLELVSCNPRILGDSIFDTSHYCNTCNLFFDSQKKATDHFSSVHNQRKNLHLHYNMDILIKFKQANKEYHKIQLPAIYNLSSEEQQILKVQLYMMKRKRSIPLICGQCLTTYSNRCKGYIKYLKHISAQHEEISPLNTHLLICLEQNYVSQDFDNNE